MDEIIYLRLATKLSRAIDKIGYEVLSPEMDNGRVRIHQIIILLLHIRNVPKQGISECRLLKQTTPSTRKQNFKVILMFLASILTFTC